MILFLFLDVLFRKANIEGSYSNDRNTTVNVWYNISDFHYTKLTPHGKVRQNKPLGLISYSTVLYDLTLYDLSTLNHMTKILCDMTTALYGFTTILYDVATMIYYSNSKSMLYTDIYRIIYTE